MANKYLEKLAIDAGVAKATAKYLGKDLIYGGTAAAAGGVAGAAIGKKLNKKNPKAGEGWGAFAGSHIAAAPVSIGLAYHAMKGMAKKALEEAKEEKPKKHRLATFAGMTSGGVIGAENGAIAGSMLGPVGALAGATAGLIGGAALGRKITQKAYEKKASDNKPKKFSMPKDKPTIATKEELIDKINDNLLKRDQIRADQETQVWKETKRTNDIKEKEVGKMDKLKIVADVTKEKIKAKAKAKGAKK